MKKLKNSAQYFVDAEFRKCTPPCSIDDMQQVFLDKLDELRFNAGIPLVLSCAYRSVEYDKKKGRSGKSAHCSGLAVDIRCTTGINRLKIISAARRVGINRMGINRNYIHVDMGERVGLPCSVWVYDDKGNAV